MRNRSNTSTKPTSILANVVMTIPLSELKRANRVVRKYTEQQIETICKYISKTGYLPPILIDENQIIIVGEEVFLAGQKLGYKQIQVVSLAGLSREQRISVEAGFYKIQELGKFDEEVITDLLREAMEIPHFDFEAINFSTPDLNKLLATSANIALTEDDVPEVQDQAISTTGDLWRLGKHYLYNGTARSAESYKKLLKDKLLSGVFADPPYNVKTQGHIGGSGKIKHPEFLEAAGEMTREEFTKFLEDFLTHSAKAIKDGGILYVCMDWRHLGELQEAGERAGLHIINMCVWVKDNGGMGSFYRSQHEIIYVFKKGNAPHTNNVQLGKFGRYRTNVWQYKGVNSFGSGRMEELAMHPTVKPAEMVHDAILDSTNIGEYVLDPYAGSGTIFVACEKSGRIGLGIEISPHYVDVSIRRWQALTGKKAVHAVSGQTFNDIAAEILSGKTRKPVARVR